MTWLGSWLQKVTGLWLGSAESEAPGAMAARLAGTSTLIGNVQGAVNLDLSATLTGLSVCSAAIEIAESAPTVVAVAAALAGCGTLMATLTTDEIDVVSVSLGRSTTGSPWIVERASVDLAVWCTGSGQLQGGATGYSRGYLLLTGRGSLSAWPVVDITRLLKRRREEDELTAILMAVGI